MQNIERNINIQPSGDEPGSIDFSHEASDLKVERPVVPIPSRKNDQQQPTQSAPQTRQHADNMDGNAKRDHNERDRKAA